MNEIKSKQLTTKEACKISTPAHILQLDTAKPKQIYREIKTHQDVIKLRKRYTITSRYNNCVLLLSPTGLRTFPQQITILQHHFIC